MSEKHTPSIFTALFASFLLVSALAAHADGLLRGITSDRFSSTPAALDAACWIRGHSLVILRSFVNLSELTQPGIHTLKVPGLSLSMHCCTTLLPEPELPFGALVSSLGSTAFG
jgi:hypothetical protein